MTAGKHTNLGPFRLLWRSLGRHRVDLAIAVGAAAGAQIIGIPLALLTRWVVNRAADRVEAPAATIVSLESALWIFGSVFAALVLLRGILRWQQTMRGERASQRVLAEVRGQMYQHLQSLSQGYFDRRPAGKILVRFIGDANALRTWIARTVVTLPADVLTIGAVAIALGIMNVQLLMAAALPLMLLPPVLLWINPRARRWTREGRRS